MTGSTTRVYILPVSIYQQMSSRCAGELSLATPPQRDQREIAHTCGVQTNQGKEKNSRGHRGAVTLIFLNGPQRINSRGRILVTTTVTRI